MRVLIVAEGAHELSGALQTLVERCAPNTWEYESDRIQNHNIHAHHGKGSGFFKRAIRWMLTAKQRGFDALVLLIDQDGQAISTVDFSNAQHNDQVPIQRALGVAVRTFDAWMLADEQALTTVLGQQINRQRDPEALTDPKGTCRGLLQHCQFGSTQAQMYAALSEAINLDLMKSRCPTGFAPFAERVAAIRDR